jgi:hypothetical protein
MNEAPVEKKIIQRYKAAGGHAFKFTSPGRRGVPDRLALAYIPVKDQETVARYVKFIEAKAPGKAPRPDQEQEIHYLASMGYWAGYIDGKTKQCFKSNGKTFVETELDI